MTLKPKSWVWWLTFPFAHRNYTTLGTTLYYPKGMVPNLYTIRHEEIHARQQQEIGLIPFVLLYLLALPILWNPWRWKWEHEAYVKGSYATEKETTRILRSMNYGWLILNRGA